MSKSKGKKDGKRKSKGADSYDELGLVYDESSPSTSTTKSSHKMSKPTGGRSQPSDNQSNKALYCVGIPDHMYNQQALEKHFDDFGTVVNLSLSGNPTKKYAVIEYDLHKSAKRALDKGANIGDAGTHLNIKWYTKKNFSGLLQFTYKQPVKDNEIAEFIRRSERHHNEFKRKFENFAYAHLNGKVPKVVAKFDPKPSRKSKGNEQYSQESFEKDCRMLSNEFFSKYLSQSEHFDQEESAEVKKQIEWTKFNEEINIKNDKNQEVSVFARWDPSGTVKLIGLSEDVTFVMQFLRSQCKLSSSTSDHSPTDLKSSSISFSQSSYKELKSLPNNVQTFERELEMDNDILEFVRRSPIHLAKLIEHFKDFAQVKILGKAPKMTISFEPVPMPEIDRLIDQQQFEKTCLQKVQNYFQNFMCLSNHFEPNFLDEIKNDNGWIAYNHTVEVPISNDETAKIFIRWHSPAKGDLKLVGLSKNVKGFMDWLETRSSTTAHSEASLQVSEEFQNLTISDQDDVEPYLWRPPVMINFAYKSSSTVDERGKTINIQDCSITFPSESVVGRKRFDFALHYGREWDVKFSDLLVLTPTLECSASKTSYFKKPVIIKLPTCYIPSDSEVTVMCQSSVDGQNWTDVQEVKHGGNKWISFETNTFSWKRVVAYLWKIFRSKRLSYLCYLNPNQSHNSFLTWDIRDDIMHNHIPLQTGEAFKGTFTIGRKENLTLKISSPNTDVEPDTVEVENGLLFGPRIIYQKHFRVKPRDPATLLESETFNYEMISSMPGRAIYGDMFPFPSRPPNLPNTGTFIISHSIVNIGDRYEDSLTG